MFKKEELCTETLGNTHALLESWQSLHTADIRPSELPAGELLIGV